MCVASCSRCSALHIPQGFPQLLNGHFGFQESTHKGSHRLEEGTADPGMLLWAGQTPADTEELPLHPRFASRDVSPASPPHNHQFHLQFFNKLLNYTSLNDTLQIQQVLIANDGSERLSFDCN